ncbi:MAG TPA: heme exporter protein CcmB [Candidatus Lokiarchaeia archaeon]|nr:heme exporter protein CcmB [Candidatus Lokiarchaeia archaeon]
MKEYIIGSRLRVRIFISMLKKDFRSEARQPSDLLSIIFFDLILTFIISMAYSIGSGSDLMPLDIFIVQTWVIIFFTVLFTISKLLINEKESGTLNGMLTAPISPVSIFFCKIVFGFIILCLIEAIQVIFSIFISRPVGIAADFGSIITFVFLGIGVPTLDLTICGTIISSISIYTKHRAFVLPVLLFPVILPIITPILTLNINLLQGLPITSVISELIFIIAHTILLISLSTLAAKEMLIE